MVLRGQLALQDFFQVEVEEDLFLHLLMVELVEEVLTTDQIVVPALLILEEAVVVCIVVQNLVELEDQV
jgi:hypothetical protein